MATLSFGDLNVVNNSTLFPSQITAPLISYEDDKSDITSVIVYANKRYLVYLSYNEEELFPFIPLEEGVYTFYLFNSTNLDIHTAIKNITRESFKEIPSKTFGKLIGKTQFNVSTQPSVLLNVPADLTRTKLLLESDLFTIRNTCKSDPEAGKICEDERFLGDLVKKYLISDLVEARKYAEGRTLERILRIIERAQNGGIGNNYEFDIPISSLSMSKRDGYLGKMRQWISDNEHSPSPLLEGIIKSYIRLTVPGDINNLVRLISYLPEGKIIAKVVSFLSTEDFNMLVNYLVDNGNYTLAKLEPYIPSDEFVILMSRMEDNVKAPPGAYLVRNTE